VEKSANLSLIDYARVSSWIDCLYTRVNHPFMPSPFVTSILSFVVLLPYLLSTPPLPLVRVIDFIARRVSFMAARAGFWSCRLAGRLARLIGVISWACLEVRYRLPLLLLWYSDSGSLACGTVVSRSWLVGSGNWLWRLLFGVVLLDSIRRSLYRENYEGSRLGIGEVAEGGKILILPRDPGSYPVKSNDLLYWFCGARRLNTGAILISTKSDVAFLHIYY